jgi:glycerol-3-phosphate dehydrogenase (NAD(P)+)
VAASVDESVARMIQDVLRTSYFRVYTAHDVLGVELGGALKNVFAIAAGISDGLGLGHNPRAAILTRGLAEMTRLGVALGADPLTFSGLAGIGDLLLTATGDQSRNRTFGLEIARGKSVERIKQERNTVAEGVNTARLILEVAEDAGVELPVASEVHAILFEGKTPPQAIRDLMDREPKAERWS